RMVVSLVLLSREAGKDHPAQQGGGRGVGLNDYSATKSRRRVRRPLHHPAGGPPPPLSWGRMSAIVLATHARPSFANAIRKIVPRSRIASRLSRRWDRLSARLCPTCSPDGAERNPGTINQLYRRSRISLRSIRATKEKKEAERRQAHSPTSAPYGRGARSAERARLSASHHGACCSEQTPQLSSSYALPGTELGRSGRYPLPAVPVQRVAPQTGHHAGRAFLPGAARERR